MNFNSIKFLSAPPIETQGYHQRPQYWGLLGFGILPKGSLGVGVFIY